MKKDVIKEGAVALRKIGKTYSEIQKIVGKDISKSTLSCWCGKIPLNKKQRGRITDLMFTNLKNARTKAIVVNKQKRINYLRSIESRNTHLVKFLDDNNVRKLLLAMLYLGEGAKWKSHRGLQLGSSNPEIIKLYLSLLQDCFNVSKKQLTVMIYYRADQNLNNLVRFWSMVTGIPTTNFYKSKPDERTRGVKTREGYYGVCAIFGPGRRSN